MTDTITVALIYGSARENRFCDTVVDWVLSELRAMKGFAVVRLDPAELVISARGPDAASVERIEAVLTAADAILIVTPEYNHGYPAPLKAIIDSTFKPWHAKPVAFVSYGGISGGLRAVEQLRQVFAELHAVTIRETVSLAHAWALFDSAGNPFRPAQMNGPLFTMMARLLWWAHTLRRARSERNYDEAAA
ncbi:NAD(P)H-dependent oxidoreductase [Rhizobium sp. TRM95111]|uniref:NADPH-dependent FMN reductase n=1 Tax=Rhizobium alarense TaxID=2846851 RepID=UPI001F37E0CC|nr:NAD(P)H-dependent oxidoreductase [Rhizobium alarense]MCF3640700.1 NAD(P)H-dependent oxidoreductase [Rhizobium alarense]